MSRCDQWNLIERASDQEGPRAARAAAALHVRSCDSCRATLRAQLRVRRAIRSIPMLAMDPAISARCQAAVMMARNLALQSWLRRSTAVAAAILAVCTLAATFAKTTATVSEEAVMVSPVIDRTTDTPQQVTQWIVQDLSRGRR